MSIHVASTETLPCALDALVRDRPDTTLLIDAVTDTRITAREFDQENRRWARRLAALGIKPGDNVATMMGPTFDAYNAWLGISGLAASEVPINPQLRGRSLTYMLNHAQAESLIVHKTYLEQVAQIADTLESLRIVIIPDLADGEEPPVKLPFQIVPGAQFRSQEADVDYRLAERHDTACIIYTSGTTGPPKGVIVPWGQMSVTPYLVPERITGGTRYTFLSPAHMSGKNALNLTVVEKRTLVLREVFSVREYWNDIKKYDCRVSQLFPLQIKYLLEAAAASGEDRYVPLKHIWTAPITPETEEFSRRFNVALTTGFGSTEVGGPIAGIDFDIDGVNIKSCGTVNTHPRGYEVRLVNELDEEVGVDEVGELIVRTSVPWTLNAGYYRNAEATAEAWRNGWFHTGDAMTKDADGNFYFVDRFKDCIRRKGENISSFELEDYAKSYPGVVDAAAVGVPGPGGEQEVKIFVMPIAGETVDLGALGTWMAEQMPKFMIPRYLELAKEFPRTPTTGRIQKNILRAQAPGAGQWDRGAR
jgi:crotonobetaine/carnitine-CoA ligase